MHPQFLAGADFDDAARSWNFDFPPTARINPVSSSSSAHLLALPSTLDR